MVGLPIFVKTAKNNSMIYSFFGDNNFLAILELEKLIADFKLKQREIYKYNFNMYDSSDDTKDKNEGSEKPTIDNSKTKEKVAGSPSDTLLNKIFYDLNFIDLFFNHKLIVIKYLNEKELAKKDLEFLKISLKKIESTSNVTVIFVNQKPLSLLSKLKVKKQEFTKLSSRDLSTFIDNTANNNNVSLTIRAKKLLTSFFSDDIGSLYNEIIKLSNYKPNIDDHDILALIKEPNLSNIFGLTDAIASKNKTLAIKLLWQEYNAGTFDLLIFGTIVNHIRNAILIKEYQKSPKTPIDVHRFVQQKLLPFVNSFSLKQLQLMIAELFKYDLQIKKGKISAILALELFINDII